MQIISPEPWWAEAGGGVQETMMVGGLDQWKLFLWFAAFGTQPCSGGIYWHTETENEHYQVLIKLFHLTVTPSSPHTGWSKAGQEKLQKRPFDVRLDLALF